MLVSTHELLQDAQKAQYAIGAFNVENMEMIMAVLAAAEAKSSPVIMQTTPGTVKYAGFDYYYANVTAAAKRSHIPVAIHLDHGNSFDMAMRAYRAGYTSIMIDGSKLPLPENIELTKSVVDVCHPGSVPVEGELGRVGGKEDDMDAGDNIYTIPEEAAEFVERTKVDSLAVGIGTAHGIYKGTPKVNLTRLQEIHNTVDIPLVLHGTSGVPDEQVICCVKSGICKVNYATDLRIAFTKGIKSYMEANPEAFDPKSYARAGMAEVQAYVEQKMDMLGSSHKA